MSLQRMQASLKDYQCQLLLLRHIYAFTLLMRGYYGHSKKKSGHIQMPFFFFPSSESRKFTPYFKGKPFITIRNGEMVYWSVSLVKAGQHLCYYFIFKMEENGTYRLSF